MPRDSYLSPWDEEAPATPTMLIEVGYSVTGQVAVPRAPRLPTVGMSAPPAGIVEREMTRPGWSIPLSLALEAIPMIRVSRRPTVRAPTAQMRASTRPTSRPSLSAPVA